LAEGEIRITEDDTTMDTEAPTEDISNRQISIEITVGQETIIGDHKATTNKTLRQFWE
jgi:hypothetical protein